MKMVTVKPAQSKRVRDPAAGFELLPESGRRVELDSFWARRLADADVELVTEPEPAAVKPQPDKGA